MLKIPGNLFRMVCIGAKRDRYFAGKKYIEPLLSRIELSTWFIQSASIQFYHYPRTPDNFSCFFIQAGLIGLRIDAELLDQVEVPQSVKSRDFTASCTNLKYIPYNWSLLHFP